MIKPVSETFDCSALRYICTLLMCFSLLVCGGSVKADTNVLRNGVTWANTFEGNVADLTVSSPSWSVFDKNNFATESTDGDIYKYVSGAVGVSNSYIAPNWSGSGTARTAEIRVRVPNATLEATDGSAAFTASNLNAYDLRIFHNKLAFNGTGGLLAPGNVVSIDMSHFRILRAIVDTSAPFVYSLYIDNDPNPVLQKNDFWFGGFDSFIFGDLSTGGISGEVEVDYISWTPGSFVPGGTLSELEWLPDSGGDWNDGANWTSGQIPNGNDQTALFGAAIATPRTVFNNRPITLNTLRFNSAVTYAIAGTGMLNLESTTGTATIDVAGGAGAGAHQLQLPFTFIDNTEVTVGFGAILAVNNAAHLGSSTITKSGAGTLLINNQLGGGAGNVSVSEGTLGGHGRVFGNVTSHSGAIVAPGKRTGKLTVTGNYLQEAGVILSIELGGKQAGKTYDVLNVQGNISLVGGSLEVLLTDGFTPSPGDSFDILDFSSLSGSFSALSLPSGIEWNTSQLLTSGVIFVASGDFDQDGDVDGADFLIWQRGFGTTGGATLTEGDANGDGNVNGLDLSIWQNTYSLSLGSLSAVVSVPEPSSMLLVVMVLLCFQQRTSHIPRL